jgi:hypothetical protein
MIEKILFRLFLVWSACCISSCSDSRHRKVFEAAKSDTNIIKLASVPDTLAYVWRKLDNGDTITKDGHRHITLIYPEFKNYKMLNDTINKRIGDMNGWEAKPEIAANNSEPAKDENALSDESDDITDYGTGFGYDDYLVNIIGQYRGFIVFDFSHEESGGAHPNHDDTYLNWDSKAHKTILLSQLFINGYNEKLNRIAENLFRKVYKLPRKGTLAPYFDAVDFFLPENFSIRTDGLNFFYGSYTIVPYGYGYPELFIPYSSIKHLLRPNTVISQYIK